MSDNEVMGPISYLIVEYPENKMTGEALPILVDLADKGVIRILDLLFVTRGADGTISAAELRDLDGDGVLDIAVLEGLSSGLLNESDLPDLAEVIRPGSSAAALLFENRWAASFVDALVRGGAQLVSAGYIPHDDVVAALDDLDS